MSFKLIIVLLIVNYVYVLSSEGNYLFERGGGEIDVKEKNNEKLDKGFFLKGIWLVVCKYYNLFD